MTFWEKYAGLCLLALALGAIIGMAIPDSTPAKTVWLTPSVALVAK